MAEKKRRTRDEGSIRQRKDGAWEARFVVGVDPGTGKDIRKSVYARTQKEVRKKMTEAVTALDKDDYREPTRMTTGQWMDSWQESQGQAVHQALVRAADQAVYQACPGKDQAGRPGHRQAPAVL